MIEINETEVQHLEHMRDLAVRELSELRDQERVVQVKIVRVLDKIDSFCDRIKVLLASKGN